MQEQVKKQLMSSHNRSFPIFQMKKENYKIISFTNTIADNSI